MPVKKIGEFEIVADNDSSKIFNLNIDTKNKFLYFAERRNGEDEPLICLSVDLLCPDVEIKEVKMRGVINDPDSKGND